MNRPYCMSKQKVKIFVSYANVHQRVILAEIFNKQVDLTTHSMGMSQDLSTATPVIIQWAHEQSGHGIRDGGYAWVQQHRHTLTKANLAVGAVECSVSRQQRPLPGVIVVPLPGVFSHPFGGRWIPLALFHHGKGNILFSLE